MAFVKKCSTVETWNEKFFWTDLFEDFINSEHLVVGFGIIPLDGYLEFIICSFRLIHDSVSFISKQYQLPMKYISL